MRKFILILALLTGFTSMPTFADSTTCKAVVKAGTSLMECVMRGAGAKEIIGSAEQNMTSYPVHREGSDVFAWEFLGKEIDCAARTEDVAKMGSKDQMLKNLATSEALCVFYVNPQTTEVEKPHVMEESTAGVSNFF